MYIYKNMLESISLESYSYHNNEASKMETDDESLRAK